MFGRNSWLQCWSQVNKKKELEKLTSSYDLDLFSLNTILDYNLNPVDYSSNRITSRYFSRHSFKEMKTKLSKDEATSFGLNRNLENLETQLLHEVDFHFNVIGVTETKITDANSQLCTAHIPGYVFEYAPTALASGGVGMFIDESLNYRVLEGPPMKLFRYCGPSFPLRIRKMLFGESFIDNITHLKSYKNLRPLGSILWSWVILLLTF